MSRRILLLDDHRESLSAMVTALEIHQHCCKTARTAGEALALVAAFRPELVLYEWWHRTDRRAGLPVALRGAARHYTTSLLVAAVSICDEPNGFVERERVDAYFTKPFRVADLCADPVLCQRA